MAGEEAEDSLVDRVGVRLVHEVRRGRDFDVLGVRQQLLQAAAKGRRSPDRLFDRGFQDCRACTSMPSPSLLGWFPDEERKDAKGDLDG
ncbi:MAG TPA: hypothetical protein VIZ91_06445 [Solirubrobacterales bacterium]